MGENYSLKESVTSSCKMYDYFLRDYDLSQRMVGFMRSKNEEQTFFTNRVKELLHGDLVSEKGIQYLVLSKDKRIPLTAAASSVKELSPFLFFLRNHSDAIFSFCIEEPEAHLHPTMQIDLADLIANASFSLIASECFENCPFSVMESQMLGTPVIGANIGGIPELIREGVDGELFESGNVEKLKERIKLLWNEEERQKQYASACETISYDSVEKYCEKLEDIYRRKGE